MLDPWIIEEIKRREEKERANQEGPRVELPLERPQYQDDAAQGGKPEEPERGVVVIDL